MVTMLLPASVGVPVISPVAPFNVSPAGKAPEWSVTVMGFVPVAVICALNALYAAPDGKDVVVIVGAAGVEFAVTVTSCAGMLLGRPSQCENAPSSMVGDVMLSDDTVAPAL